MVIGAAHALHVNNTRLYRTAPTGGCPFCSAGRADRGKMASPGSAPPCRTTIEEMTTAPMEINPAADYDLPYDEKN
jgi:hypothetical protein